MPKFYDYLKQAMGTYITDTGEEKDCFNLHFHKEVVGVEMEQNPELRVAGLQFSDGTAIRNNCSYIFCPGEAVGTLDRLGFQEPIYAGFAGASICLNIPLQQEELARYESFSHCMEVHKVGIVLAWQARSKQDTICIGVAGTKAFYADQAPKMDEDYANNRHLTQLNMINDVLPEIVSLACGFETKGLRLTEETLDSLKHQGILDCWVGRRAVAYDGFPTLGALYSKGARIANARCTTHLGSGGVSFGPIAVLISRLADEYIDDPWIEKVLHYADSRR